MWEQRIARLFSILSHLSPHSQLTVQDLAKEYEVDERTIERDIQLLESAQLGIFYDENASIKISRIGYRRIRSWILGCS